jgi:hypothetical protein
MSITTNTPATTTQIQTQSSVGNIQGEYIVNIALTPASVAAATIAEQSFTVTGLQLGDQVVCSKPAMANAVGVLQARVSALNTLTVAYINPTAGALVPTAETYTLNVVRPVAAAVTASFPIGILVA